jgi:hypothetical protein
MAKATERSEIRLKGVSNQLKHDLTNISKNTGLTLSGFVKSKLREIAESYPDRMKIAARD